MKIKLSANQFFDNEGKPLSEGRISVFLHGSDTLADIAIMNGDSYYAEMNPLYCDESGRINTVYFDAAIVDVKVEKPNGDGTYELLDTYQDGFSVPQGTSDTAVRGIAELKNVQPSGGMVVQVSGYDSEVFAPTRFYVYDPSATAPADDGVVIASDHGDGRWILLWDCDSLPCTVYGIKPGHEANIGAFLDFPDHIGQWDIRTPSKARFLSGTYTSNAVFSTTRGIKFDKGAKFAYAVFQLPLAEIDDVIEYVADFYFTNGSQSVARSGWFRSIKSFWRCNASELVIDKDFSSDKSVDGVCTVNGKTVSGCGRLAATYTDSGYIHFNSCNIKAKSFIAPSSDKVKISGCRWNDEWWTTTANASVFNFIALSGTYAGAFVDFRTINSNLVEIDDFSNANIFLKAAICDVGSNALLDKRLFCRGRSFSSMIASVFTEIHDATIDGACELSATTLKIYNVKAQTSFKFNGNELRVYDGCDLKLAAGCTLSVLQAYDSKITKDTALDVFPTISAYRCEWKASMAAATDNETNTTAAAFEHCLVHDSVFLHKHLSFFSCTITNCQIGVYPYKENNAYKMNFVMEGCSHISSAPVVFNNIDDLGDVCNNIEPTIRIVNNTFSGNAIGVRAPFYSSLTNRTLFFKGGALSGFEYSGNGGACPSDSAQSNHSQYFVATTSSDTEIPNSGYVSPVEIRAFPTFCQRSALTTINFGRYTQEWLLSNQEDIVALEKIGKHIVHSVQLTPWATDEYNDYFSLRYYDTSDQNKTIVIM